MTQQDELQSIEKTAATSDCSVNESECTQPKVEETVPQANNSGYNNGEHDFDTGFKAWLQVVGSFFLFFNSWYVLRRRTDVFRVSLLERSV